VDSSVIEVALLLIYCGKSGRCGATLCFPAFCFPTFFFPTAGCRTFLFRPALRCVATHFALPAIIIATVIATSVVGICCVCHRITPEHLNRKVKITQNGAAFSVLA